MGVIETQGFKLDNTGRRIVVDPVTRIEGHMRCEVNVDKDNIIRNAVSTGTMWRGLEVILKGRDPRDAWAFVERICGVCTGCHALTSVRAVEDALGIKIPLNAHLIREMMAKTLQVHDHAVHFYHLHALDWVDVVSALNADPKKTSELQQLVSPSHPLSSPGYFRDVQNRLKKFVDAGQLGPFMNGYWGSKAYVLPPEANLMAVTHYLEALDLQKEWVKVHTIFGGKNPHPNYLVGGVPCAINLDGTGAAGARSTWSAELRRGPHPGDDRVQQERLPARRAGHRHALQAGGLAVRRRPVGHQRGRLRHLREGALRPQHPAAARRRHPERQLGRDPADRPARPRAGAGVRDPQLVPVRRRDQGPAPWDGVTEPSFKLGANTKGTKTAIENLDESAKYSWIKSPRWRGHAVEVGRCRATSWPTPMPARATSSASAPRSSWSTPPR
jgi:hydrogenase large subunit